MTPEQKIKNVEAQILACEQGRTDCITCPYCRKANYNGNPLCCEKFGRLVAAILIRKEDGDRAEVAEQIAEKVSRN